MRSQKCVRFARTSNQPKDDRGAADCTIEKKFENLNIKIKRTKPSKFQEEGLFSFQDKDWTQNYVRQCNNIILTFYHKLMQIILGVRRYFPVQLPDEL